MEICFDGKLVNGYREVGHQIKRIQESAETVVPDTNDDIGRVASLQTGILLKTKDVSPGGVTITGEAVATLIYITENECGTSFVKLSKPFTIEYEAEGVSDTTAQIGLCIANSEARVLNPRKVSVTFEIVGELTCYRNESIMTDCLPKENSECHVHSKQEQRQIMLTSVVGEKSFAVNEQFTFPGGKPKAGRLISCCPDFSISDCQIIGSKVILKGNVSVCAAYKSDEVNYPVKIEFTTPFSQIIDTGEENIDGCSAFIQLTSGYYELVDTINGDKALDMELHALTQIVCRTKRTVCYISDAYSNRMPVSCTTTVMQYSASGEPQRAKLCSDERISVVEDCADVLSIFTAVTQVTSTPGKISAVLVFDIVYRTVSGTLSAAKRTAVLEGDCPGQNIRILGTHINDIYLRPDGPSIDSHIALEVRYQCCNIAEIKQVSAVTLNEDESFDRRDFPSVYLVRAEKESLWELAKEYHSSEEQILELNDISDGIEGKMLLIARSAD